MEPELVNKVNTNTSIDMPNLLENQIGQGEKISVFPLYEYWLDVGQIEEYKKANREFTDIL